MGTYIIPSYNLLDELAETYGFTEAGRELKLACERSNLMVEQERAEACDYVEQKNRMKPISCPTARFGLERLRPPRGRVDRRDTRWRADFRARLDE